MTRERGGGPTPDRYVSGGVNPWGRTCLTLELPLAVPFERERRVKTTIVLADDHPIVRQGLRSVLEAEPDFRVIGEAGDGLETMQLVERLRPQVLVLDLLMPGLSGLEVARQVRQRAPETRVIVLSMHANEAYVLEALRHGAAAYVLKEISSAELVQAVRAVVAGQRYLSRRLSERAREAHAQRAEATPDLYETLTTREREVLHLAAEGCSN